eukprot:11117214-Heterocapsa_arctica.AAC.1
MVFPRGVQFNLRQGQVRCMPNGRFRSHEAGAEDGGVGSLDLGRKKFYNSHFHCSGESVVPSDDHNSPGA